VPDGLPGALIPEELLEPHKGIALGSRDNEQLSIVPEYLHPDGGCYLLVEILEPAQVLPFGFGDEGRA